MASVNKVILIGGLTRDPEVRYIGDGTAVANFTVATSEKWKDKNSGEQKQKSEYHRIVAWRRLGEICGQYLQKGSQIYIEGRLQTRSWEQDGVTKYSTDIVAATVEFLSPKSEQRPDTGYPEPPMADSQNDDSSIPF